MRLLHTGDDHVGAGHRAALSKLAALAAKISQKRSGHVEVLVLATKPDIEVVPPPISLDPVATKHRFMAAIGTPRYIPTFFGGGMLEQAPKG